MDFLIIDYLALHYLIKKAVQSQVRENGEDMCPTACYFMMSRGRVIVPEGVDSFSR